MQDLLDPSKSDDPTSLNRAWKSPTAHQSPKANQSVAPWRNSNDEFPNLPPREEAERLLRITLFYIGQTQHHIDARDFSDRLWSFYENRNDQAQRQSPWCLEMILLIAIGTVFDVNPEGNDEFSGARLFEYAHKNVPSLTELHSYGKLGVEIFALFAVYLQNVDRREESYLYVCLIFLHPPGHLLKLPV